MAEFGVPPRCTDRCILAQIPNLDVYGIVLNRNCDGPRVSFDEINSRVELRRGGVAEEVGSHTLQITDASGGERTVVFTDSADGEIVCRNAGANRSIDQALMKGRK